MRNYNKYKKYIKKRKTISPLKLTIIILAVLIVMAIGYSSSNDILRFAGTANIRDFSITYNLNGGNALQNPITRYDATTAALLPLATRSNYNFMGWYEDPDFLGQRIEMTPTRIRCTKSSTVCKMGT